MKNKRPGELKKLCDIQVRRYLLKNAKRDGYGRIFCPLKQRWYPQNKMHVAHYVDRNRMSCRFHEHNVHLISEQSNVWDAREPAEGYKSLHHKEYEFWLKNKIGEKNFENLLELSKSLSIFGVDKYLEVLEQYKIEEDERDT